MIGYQLKLKEDIKRQMAETETKIKEQDKTQTSSQTVDYRQGYLTSKGPNFQLPQVHYKVRNSE